MRIPIVRIEFEWMVASKGYTIVEQDRAIGLPNCQIVSPVPGSTRLAHPYHQFPGLFKQFASLDQTPDAVVRFANKFGLLQRAPAENALDQWYRYSKDLADLTSPAHVGARAQDSLRRINGILRNAAGTGICETGIVIKPRSLLAAMALQLGFWLHHRDDRIGQCLVCGTTWLIGPRTGHRVTREYCSAACRDAARYRRKKTTAAPNS
jgi:hypothetical protein